MAFLGIPPSDLDLECDIEGTRVNCTYSSAGVSTSILVREGSESLIIDVGDGALRDLIEKARTDVPASFDETARIAMGAFVEGIRAIALTHDHFDHVGGLFSILRFLDMVGRRSPLMILAPFGSRTVEGSIALFRQGGARFEVDTVALVEDGKVDIGGWGIEWVQVAHCDLTIDGQVGPKVPAVAYLVSRRKVRIFFTGDTAYDERIAASANGCDLAIAEATFPDGGGHPAHMSVDEAYRVLSGAKRGWLVHLTGASNRSSQGRSPRK